MHKRIEKLGHIESEGLHFGNKVIDAVREIAVQEMEPPSTKYEIEIVSGNVQRLSKVLQRFRNHHCSIQ